MTKHRHKFFGGILIFLGVLFAVSYLFGGFGRGYNSKLIYDNFGGYDGDEVYYSETEEAAYGGIATNRAYPQSAPLPRQDFPSSYADPVELGIERQVISRGYLSLVVDEVEKSVDDIRSLVESRNGFLDNASINEYGNDQKRGNVTLRVPSEHFDSTFESLKNISINVLEESISSDDVTQQVVDLDARLKNLYSVEEQYTEVLDSADTVEDILKVRQVLDRTREEIERLTAQKLYLSQQVSFATITVSLVSEAEVEVAGLVWDPLVTAKIGFNNLVAGITYFVDFLIEFILYLPLLVVWGLLIYAFLGILWKIIRAIKWRLFRSHHVTPPQRKTDMVKRKPLKKSIKKAPKKK